MSSHASSGKIDRQPGYILHAQPYRETSLLLDVFTRDHGRVALVARGARRPRAELRGLLLPLQPLELSWFGKNEVRTLHSADWTGGVPQLAGLALISGFYLNELVVRLTARDDPHPDLWPVFDRAVRSLAGSRPLAETLRVFELGLISSLGYAPELRQDCHGAAVRADAVYVCRSGHAPEPGTDMPPPPQSAEIAGATLLAMANNDFSDELTRRQARGLMRLILSDLLGGGRLATRDLLQALSFSGEPNDIKE
ncbi:DNA repair protein RecO [Paludibacterium paludis]|uniref:DNA repair protein RecO n=1 Tax=Paludibacterium paludis TaxID=1225769 RepID=A0A918NY70_9NEIS|nr:DNA repair protein RecO [Paludibacterium paludis]GGY06345.1 DNA repair protein RecO [Paludibacterium paludis]